MTSSIILDQNIGIEKRILDWLDNKSNKFKFRYNQNTSE